MTVSWCKVASNLDSHPKIRKAGRNGREVFLFALRRNAEPNNPIPGHLPLEMLEPWYLADQLMMSEAEAVTGVTAAVTAGLIARDGDQWTIVGWDDDWGKTAATGAERTKRWREKKWLADHVTPRDGRDVTESHRDACDALDQIRSEEKRSEEKREEDQNPLKPPKGGKRSRSKAKFECSPDERAAADRVLAKLTERNGIAYSSDKHVALVVGRLREGVTELELRAVIAYCAVDQGWLNKPAMVEYLRPSTLFGPEKIHDYLDPARSKYADQIAKHTATPTLQLVEEAS